MITLQQAEIRSGIIKAMAHPARLMIIEYLKAGTKPFSDVFGLFNLDKSTVSKHLLVLKGAGIVSSRKEGPDMMYTLEVPCCCLAHYSNQSFSHYFDHRTIN